MCICLFVCEKMIIIIVSWKNKEYDATSRNGLLENEKKQEFMRLF